MVGEASELSPLDRVIALHKSTEQLIRKCHSKWVKWAEEDAFLAWPAEGSFDTPLLVQLMTYLENKYRKSGKEAKKLADHVQIHSWFVMTKAFLEKEEEISKKSMPPPPYSTTDAASQMSGTKCLVQSTGPLPPLEEVVTAIGYSHLIPTAPAEVKLQNSPSVQEMPMSGTVKVEGTLHCVPVNDPSSQATQVAKATSAAESEPKSEPKSERKPPVLTPYPRLILTTDNPDPTAPVSEVNIPAPPPPHIHAPLNLHIDSPLFNTELIDKVRRRRRHLAPEDERHETTRVLPVSATTILTPAQYVTKMEQSDMYVIIWLDMLHGWTLVLSPQMRVYPLQGSLESDDMNTARSAIVDNPDPCWSVSQWQYMRDGLAVWEKYEGQFPDISQKTQITQAPWGERKDKKIFLPPTPVTDALRALPIVTKTSSDGAPRPIYIPWTFTDMHTILSKLPLLSRGAEGWIQALEKHTIGMQLALGDVKALFAQTPGLEQSAVWSRCKRSQVMQTQCYDGDSFNPHRPDVWEALRHLYPKQRDFTRLSAARWNPKATSFDNHLHSFQEVFSQEMNAPYNEPNSLPFFCHMFLQTLPDKLRLALSSVVGITDMYWTQMHNQFLHHVRKFEEAREKPQEELMKAQTKVCALQLKQLQEQKTDEQDRRAADSQDCFYQSYGDGI
ncbi:uncharacterized protein LOC115088197 [Rhinatrema bivittatum]|uniref:uncharacterized protein LOC115082689 n=1 Tax=Rhinatrema bivittatum TaxID=194408 RepID=UPI001126308D|nr:uncharacterized protein LOC115082689 [Rhinatrema bivittatum]XP_029452083.1 uncharacterized protein LOC115088197 [Rhinatrema bivittatum]